MPLGLLTHWYRRRSQHTYRRTRRWIAQVIVQFVETMNGIRAVQAFRREQRNASIMARLNNSFADAETEANWLVARFTSTVRIVGSVSIAVTLLLGGLRVLEGSLTLGVLAAFVLYLRRFYGRSTSWPCSPTPTLRRPRLCRCSTLQAGLRWSCRSWTW